jgi:hypothetical protein
MCSVKCILYCLHVWQTIFSIFFLACVSYLINPHFGCYQLYSPSMRFANNISQMRDPPISPKGVKNRNILMWWKKNKFKKWAHSLYWQIIFNRSFFSSDISSELSIEKKINKIQSINQSSLFSITIYNGTEKT